jgi:hypothetical protein
MLFRQQFYYLGLTARLKAMLEDPALSPHLLLPLPQPPRVPGEQRSVHNIYESQAWYEQVECGIGRDGTGPTDFGHNRRNIVISLNVDGFQPWKRIGHSITPMVAMILNLPENLRHKSEHLILAGLIPGPSAPKELNPFMSKFVDELKRLYTDGLTFTDPITKAEVTVKVKLLNICADIPAHSDLLYQQTTPAFHGCFKCHVEVSNMA